MKAIIQERTDLQMVVGDDDVPVRVRAASVHPDVWHVVTGRPYVLRLTRAGFPDLRTQSPAYNERNPTKRFMALAAVTLMMNSFDELRRIAPVTK